MPTAAARCSNLHIAEQTVNGCGADSTKLRSLSPSCFLPSTPPRERLSVFADALAVRISSW
jgi:hypothetical protein